MASRKKLKIRSVLIALNLLVIFLIIAFYLCRMYRFYKEENSVTDVTTNEISLFDYLSNKRSYTDDTKGLVFNEKKNTYTYKGKVNDNYLSYSGILFRIVGIDNANNIKLVTDSNITLMYSGLEKGYKDSYINTWLNKSETKHSGIFEKNLYDADTYLSNTYMCNDEISDLKTITCDKVINDYKMTILSLYDYNAAGGKDSYLNKSEAYYLNTLNDKKVNYFVTINGDIGEDTVISKIHGVRPVITINGNTILLSGKGTESNPYIIEKHDKNTINDLYVGEIINFSDNNYKIIDKEEDKIKVALDGILMDDENEITKTFGGSSNKYSTSKNTIGYYLNNDFYKTLTKPDYIVKSDWYIGTNVLSALSYIEKYDSSVSANIGMLSLGELFVNDIAKTFTISCGIESSMIITVINENKGAFGDLIATSYNVRPSFYLKNDMAINGGEGTTENPYLIGEESDYASKEKTE